MSDVHRNMEDGDSQQRLHRFLQEQLPLLHGIVRSYVMRMGLAQGEAVSAIATEITQDALFEALIHPERFAATSSPRAWFLAVAVNIIKRKKVEAAKRQRREVVVSDLIAQSEADSEHDFFDQIGMLSFPGPEQAIEADEHIVEILSYASPADSELLRIAILTDMDMNILAQKFDIAPGTARVRVHRALRRLRVALNEQEQKREKGESHV